MKDTTKTNTFVKQAANITTNTEIRSKKYIFVINNPGNQGLTHQKIYENLNKASKSCKYSIMGDEISEKGTPHTHVFAYFNNVVRFSQLKKHFPTAHIEKANGSIQDNINYIEKEGSAKNLAKAHTKVPNSISIFGTRPEDEKQGKKPIYDILYDSIIEQNLPNFEAIQRNHELTLYSRQMNELRDEYIEHKYFKRIRDVRVHYIFGAPGTGKTYSIHQKYDMDDFYRVTGYNHPFDNYISQPVLVLDEYHSNLSITDILNILDKYPYKLNARYKNKTACYETVYIISNLPLEEQYQDVQKDSPDTWKAFLRRIHTVTEYKSAGEIIEHGNGDEYMEKINTFKKIHPSKTPFRKLHNAG